MIEKVDLICDEIQNFKEKNFTLKKIYHFKINKMYNKIY
jgi:hypothetical protein